jgi:maleylpyruvate isomerase
MGPPRADLDGVRSATRRLLDSLENLTDAQAGRGCLLPDWTRAELLTHIARNADGFRRIADGAALGEEVDQYPGGAEQRARDIAAGRETQSATLRSEVRRSADALMDAWRALPDDAWEREGRALTGRRTVAHTVWGRWREVELHHLDLDLGYEPSQWAIAFVRRGLEERMWMLDGRQAPESVAAAEFRCRIEASDQGDAWLLTISDGRLRSEPALPSVAVNSVVTGWGCDVLAWLYGRDERGVNITVTGDPVARELPELFPFN